MPRPDPVAKRGKVDVKQKDGEEKIEAAYPPVLIKELKALKRGSGTKSSKTSSTPQSVYVVTNMKLGKWVPPVCQVVGTYSTREAANLQVLKFVIEHDGTNYLEDGAYDPAQTGSLTKMKGWTKNGEDSYWIDENGLLSLFVDYGKRGDMKVCVTKQEVSSDGLTGNSISVFDP